MIKKFSFLLSKSLIFFVPKIEYQLVAESFDFAQDKLRAANQNRLQFPIWCPSPKLIIIFEDLDYMAMIKEKLAEIKQFAML